MKKILGAVFLLVVIVAGAYFIVNTSGEKSAGGETIRIGVNVYPGTGAFYIAQEKGFFKKYGVDAEVVMLPVDSIAQALASDDVQMLYMSTDYVSVLKDSGIDARQIFAPSMSDGADGFVATKDVTSIADLRGKDIYLGLGFPSHFLTRYVLAREGITSSSVKLVNMSPEDVGISFVSGKIDAGATWEPWLSKAAERSEGKVLFTSRDIPGVIVDAAIVRADSIKTQRDDLENVMRAFFDAVEWWEANPAEGNGIAARALNLTAEEFIPTLSTVKMFSLADNARVFNKEYALNVFLLAEQASRVYQEDGVIKNVFKGDSMIDGSLLEDIQ